MVLLQRRVYHSVWPDSATINRIPVSPKRFICHVKVTLVWCNTDGVVTAQNDECHIVPSNDLLLLNSSCFAALDLCYMIVLKIGGIKQGKSKKMLNTFVTFLIGMWVQKVLKHNIDMKRNPPALSHKKKYPNIYFCQKQQKVSQFYTK